MSSLSSLSSLSSRLTVSGLATGLDTDRLIEGLLAVQKAQVSRLQDRQKDVTTEQTAFKTVEATLLTLQSTLNQLGRPQNNVFDGRTVTSSAPDLVTAAASSSAVEGTYTLKVTSVARAHQIASQGFASATSKITQGTLTIKVGAATTTITIDSSNDTLQGLANAINAAGAGVTATLVNDGRNEPYRLVLTSNKTGTDNAISITNGLAAGDADHDPMKPEFSATSIGLATAATTNSSTSVATAGGTYTGTSNRTYTLTVKSVDGNTTTGTSGTVGTNVITLSVKDDSGTTYADITLNAGEANTFKAVGTNGVQVKYSANTLVVGDSFTIDTFVPTVQQAADAVVQIGSGGGALVVTSASNTVDNFIPGVTLNLLAADPAKEVTLRVANDTEKAKQAILDFVEDYNAVMEKIDDLVRFDPETQTAGVLLGNRSVVAIQDEVRTVAVAAVAGLTAPANRLGAIGISTDDNGQLTVDTAQLEEALAGQVDGVTFQDVRRLFALTGASDNGGISFVTAGTRTKLAGDTIQVDITQPATQASLTASSALAANTTITSSGPTPNNQLTLTVDGRTATITLADGTYSRAALAEHLQAQINANTEFNNARVTVGLNADKLTITSNTYGTSSQVTILSGTALGALGLTAGQTATGQNVAGRFLVNGQEETATGSGQFLVGSTGNATTDGLQVRVTLTAAQVDPDDPEADLTVTRGIASQLNQVLNKILDPVSGRLKTINQSLQDQINDLQETIDRQNAIYEAQRESLLKQFAALETTVSQLRSAGDFLTAQVAALQALQNRR